MITFGTIQQQLYNNIVIADSTVAQLYSIDAPHLLTIAGGESAKTWDNVGKICMWLLSIGANKNSTVVAVGGGTIGDSVGLACSIYKRGINLVHVPTTLLAMVDSSIGGKTAVNMGNVKNAVGTIYPADTYIDTGFLATLSQEQIDNGMGEVYKYMLLDSRVADVLDNTEQLIKLCASVKSDIVAQDTLDTSIRQCLNMGHTIAHAIELDNNISHGQAVAVGCHYALGISLHLGLVDRQYYDMWHMNARFQHVAITSQHINNMHTDKKNTDDNITLILPTNNYQYQKVTFNTAQLLDIVGQIC